MTTAAPALPPSQQAEIPRVEWDTFIGEHFTWAQGEHVALIGPTGSGKTTLALHILSHRRYVVAFGTKPKDSTLKQLARRGYTLFRTWEHRDPQLVPRRVLWPRVDAHGLRSKKSWVSRWWDKLNGREDGAGNMTSAMLTKQHAVFENAIGRIYAEGGWCIYLDELWWFIHMLKMERTVRMLLQQSRALGITLVQATQRPAFVPLEVYDQSTHLFFWRDNDERNLKRISGIGFLSSRRIMRAVSNLEKHEVLYVNTRDGVLIRTMAPAPERIAA